MSHLSFTFEWNYKVLEDLGWKTTKRFELVVVVVDKVREYHSDIVDGKRGVNDINKM